MTSFSDRLNEELDRNATPLTNPQVGDYCAAPTEKDKDFMHRAKIIEIKSNSAGKILLVRLELDFHCDASCFRNLVRQSALYRYGNDRLGCHIGFIGIAASILAVLQTSLPMRLGRGKGTVSMSVSFQAYDMVPLP